MGSARARLSLAWEPTHGVHGGMRPRRIELEVRTGPGAVRSAA